MRLWFAEWITADEVAFEPGVFLLTKARAGALKSGAAATPVGTREASTDTQSEPTLPPETQEPVTGGGTPVQQTTTLRVFGAIPPEIWNRLGTKLLPKLRSGRDLKIGVEFSVTVDAGAASSLENDLRQALDDLGISGQVRIER